jgi:hypothetical protein
MRDPGDGADVRALSLSGDWAWYRGEREIFLLCELREA